MTSPFCFLNLELTDTIYWENRVWSVWNIICFLCLIKIGSLRLNKIKANEVYDLSCSRMLADLYKMDFGNNSCTERKILLIKHFVQVEYQTADEVHPILPCVHIRRFFFVVLMQMLLDDKAKFNDVKFLCLSWALAVWCFNCICACVSKLTCTWKKGYILKAVLIQYVLPCFYGLS